MTISTYEQVLKMTQSLGLPEQLKLLEAITRMVRTQVDKSNAHSIMELEGLGAEIWKEIDTEIYIHLERDSWDS